MAALPGDDELQALLAEMREAPGATCAPPRPAHPPGKLAPPAAAGACDWPSTACKLRVV
jgi:hypothetical protein